MYFVLQFIKKIIYQYKKMKNPIEKVEKQQTGHKQKNKNKW